MFTLSMVLGRDRQSLHMVSIQVQRSFNFAKEKKKDVNYCVC